MATIIHGGFHKCASTFLQHQIFPKLKKHKYINGTGYTDLVKYYLNDIEDKGKYEELHDRDLLISNEGYMHLDVPLSYTPYGRVRKDIFITNVSKLFMDQGRLLFVIRRQDTLIESWLRYSPAQFLSEGCFFLDYPISGKNKNFVLKNRYGYTYTSTFDFYEFFQRIATFVDKDRVHILVLEDLKHDKQRFFEKLGEAVEEDVMWGKDDSLKPVNVTQDKAVITNPLIMRYDWIEKVKKIAPPFLRKAISSKLKRNVCLSDQFKSEVMELYKERNEKLDRCWGLGLKQYGYY